MKIRLVTALIALIALGCTGVGTDKDDAPANPAQDVRGVYGVTWDDQLTIRLDVGGAVQEATAGADEVVTFNAPDGSPLELDLGAWCADEAVTCPSEAWPSRVAIDQDDPDTVADAHALRAWDADAPGAVVSGLVDHSTGAFLFGLDGDSAGDSSCAALAISLAGGTFYYPEDGVDTADSGDSASDPAAALADGVPAAAGATTGVVDGQVALGWLGACAWSGLAVVATLSIETDYLAVREGDLDHS